MDSTLTTLFDQCRAGSHAAWEEFFDQTYPVMYRFVGQLDFRLAEEDIQDICQEAFLAAVRGADGFHGSASPQTWLLRIARNKTLDHTDRKLAGKRGGVLATVSLDATREDESPALEVPSSLPGADECMQTAETHAQVIQALSTLGDACREIIELRYFGELAYEEIADALQLNAKTVSSRLSKCLDKLRAVFYGGNQPQTPSNQ